MPTWMVSILRTSTTCANYVICPTNRNGNSFFPVCMIISISTIVVNSRTCTATPIPIIGLKSVVCIASPIREFPTCPPATYVDVATSYNVFPCVDGPLVSLHYPMNGATNPNYHHRIHHCHLPRKSNTIIFLIATTTTTFTQCISPSN